MRIIKQSSTARVLMFFMASSVDHITGVTGLSPTVTLSKNGAAFGSPAGAVSEVSNGWYKVAGNATDSNTLGSLVLHATGTGADPTDVEFEVVAFDPQSATSLGLSNLDATISSRMATYTQPTGFLAATFPSGTIANTTNITAGTITTVTNLTNAPSNGDFTTTMKTSLNEAAPTVTLSADQHVIADSVGSPVTLAADQHVIADSLTSYVAPDNTGIAAIKAKTDLLNFLGAASDAKLKSILAGEQADSLGSLVENPLVADFTAQPPFITGDLTGQQGWTAGAAGTTSMVIAANGANSVPGAVNMKNFYVLPFFDATRAWNARMLTTNRTDAETNTIEMNVTTTLAVGNKCTVVINPDATVDWLVLSSLGQSAGGTISDLVDPSNLLIELEHDGAGHLSLSINGTLRGTIDNDPTLAVTTLRVTNTTSDATDEQAIQQISVIQPTLAAVLDDKAGFSLTTAYDPAKTAATQASVDALPSASTIATAVSSQVTTDHGSGTYTGGFAFTGARAVTITVNDGSSAIQAAMVRVTQGSNTQLVQTNSSGIASFSLDDGSYTLSITKGGYTFTPVTIAVDSTHLAFTKSMTAISIAVPSTGQCVGTLVLLDSEGAPEADVDVYFEAYGTGAVDGYGYSGTQSPTTTDASGTISRNFPSGSVQYRWRRGTRGDWITFETAAADGATFDIPSGVGSP